jgi:hypothetical protein
MWSMASELEQQADGFFREGGGGRLVPVCSSHAKAAEVVFIPFSAARDEYLVQGVMEE